MKNILKESQSLISIFLETLIPEEPKLRRRLAQRSKLHKDTFGKLKKRNSLSADTLFRLCLSHDISPSVIKSILKKRGDGISDGMVDWIKFGAGLSEQDMQILLDLLKDLNEYFVLRKRHQNK